jgi:MoxR-like ATPase
VRCASELLECSPSETPRDERRQAARETLKSLSRDSAVGAGQSIPLPSQPGQWRRTLPADGPFYVEQNAWDQICYAIFYGKNALLLGPSGCGKTELCYLAADATGKPIEVFHCGGMTEPRSTLIGNTHFDPKRGTWFAESRFVTAIQRPESIVLFDEASRAPREAFNLWFPLMDRQRALALDESEEAPVVRRAAGVTFLATANVGFEYTGAEPIDWALLGRFASIIHLDFPPKHEETHLLTRRCPGLDTRCAGRLAAFAARQRELAREGEFRSTVATRSLLEAGQQIADGISYETAVEHCVVNAFAAEGGDASERAKLLQLLQKDRG